MLGICYTVTASSHRNIARPTTYLLEHTGEGSSDPEDLERTRQQLSR